MSNKLFLVDLHFMHNQQPRHETIEIVAQTSMGAWQAGLNRLKAIGVIADRRSAMVKIGVRIA